MDGRQGGQAVKECRISQNDMAKMISAALHDQFVAAGFNVGVFGKAIGTTFMVPERARTIAIRTSLLGDVEAHYEEDGTLVFRQEVSE